MTTGQADKSSKSGADDAGPAETGKRGIVANVSCVMVPQNDARCNTHFPPNASGLLAYVVALFDHHVECAEYHERQACQLRRIWEALEGTVGDDGQQDA